MEFKIASLNYPDVSQLDLQGSDTSLLKCRTDRHEQCSLYISSSCISN